MALSPRQYQKYILISLKFPMEKIKQTLLNFGMDLFFKMETVNQAIDKINNIKYINFQARNHKFQQYPDTYNNICILLKKMNKFILMAILVVLASAYTEQNHVLILTDADFPDITTKFSHILIEFYAPWCGHCKKLEPVYNEVAQELHDQGSVLRVAKLDATQHKEAAGRYEVRGYPTLFFFLNGEKMDYNGPRNKEGMLAWLLKRTRDPVSEITAETYAALSSQPTTTIVYHGDYSTASGAEILNKLALADDYNNYYWGKDLGKEAGTVELIRNFDEAVTVSSIDADIKNWISKHERPPVVPFDDRTIGDMFGSGKKGVVLFNGDSSAELLEAFTSAAKEYDGEEALIFTEVDGSNQHLDNFAGYIKLDRKAFPIVVVESKAQSKYVLKEAPTKENILSFLGNFKDFKYGLTDEVKADKPAVETEEEL